MDPNQQTDDHRSRDAASSGGDADHPTDVPPVATAVDSDQQPSSCTPLSQPVISSEEALERSSPDDPHGGAQKRKRVESVSNEEPHSEKLKTLTGEDWQDHTMGIPKGAVIEFPYFEYVKNLANNGEALPGDLTWAPALHSSTVLSHRLAVVEKNLVRGGLLVHFLTEFDDDALSTMRWQMYLDPITVDLRPKLDNLLHVVALHSEGALVPEPQCFDNGIQLNWRSVNGAPPPSNKSSFMYTDEHAKLVEPESLCVIGELAEDDDFLVLKPARDALSNDLDRYDTQEIQRRREDRTRDPIGLALSLVANSLAKNGRAPSPPVSDSSQEPGPYTQRYTHKSPAWCTQSPDIDPGAGSPAWCPESPDIDGIMRHRCQSPCHRRTSPSHEGGASSHYTPGPPNYEEEGEAAIPRYNPGFRDYHGGGTEASPQYTPGSPDHYGGGTAASPQYTPGSPNYYEGAENSVFRPTSPGYGGGGSPRYAPTTP
jgi:hypothetical protein